MRKITAIKGCRYALISLLISSFLTSLYAQPQVAIRLSFNPEQNRYEILATPNFSAKNFTWGPSQVTVVLPAEVGNEPLSIRSTSVGSWADNSVIYEPVSASGADFHGMTSPGGKLDLVAGQEQLLFDFSLKSGYVDNVRLFDPRLDPGSDRSGMGGGDFRSYMSDERGSNYLQLNNVPVSLNGKAPLANEPVDIVSKVVAYPNPSTGGKFRLYLKGFQREELVTVRLVNLKGVLLHSFQESVAALAGRLIDLSTSPDEYVLLSLERQSGQQRFVQKLWFR